MLTKKEQNQLTVHFSKIFITKDYKDYADKTFATKEALEDLRIDTANGFLEAKNNLDEFRDEMIDFKEKTLTTLDIIVSEVKAIRKEQAVLNYGKRIEKLEYMAGIVSA